MTRNSAGFFSWILNAWKPVAFVFLILTTAAVVCLKTELVALLFESIIFLFVIVFSKAKAANLVIAFIITDHLCQFLKRFVFLWGAQSLPIYYIMQVLPDAIILIAGVLAFYNVSKRSLPPSTKFLFTYSVVLLLVTLLNIRAVTLQAGFSGLHAAVFEVMAVLIGTTLSFSLFGRLARLFSFLIVVSVLYGLYQFLAGPTVIDQAWASAMHEYSIEAGKVYEAITVPGTEFRAYSYYADHTTWGLFLVAALIIVIIATSLGQFPKKRLVIVAPMAVAGLIVCETRTAWLALIGTLVVYRLITTRLLRRPMLLILGVISSFAVVVTLGDYAAHHLHFGIFSSSLLSRYTTVGTIEARTSAWKLFARNLPSHWLIGLGFGYGAGEANVSMSDEVFSHNMYVELLLIGGLPGVFLFLGFFYSWIKEAFWVARVESPALAKAALWTISLAVGMLITGSVQGLTFMNLYLCLFLGLLSGEWIRLHEGALQQQSAFSFPFELRRPLLPGRAQI